jgi:hypothetical protein
LHYLTQMVILPVINLIELFISLNSRLLQDLKQLLKLTLVILRGHSLASHDQLVLISLKIKRPYNVLKT